VLDVKIMALFTNVTEMGAKGPQRLYIVVPVVGQPATRTQSR